jgi:methanogenic corrinoid protein MtbC1
MREVIEIMEEDGVRDRFKVIIGGGPTSQGYADQIGADAYAETAYDGVLFCDKVIST